MDARVFAAIVSAAVSLVAAGFSAYQASLAREAQLEAAAQEKREFEARTTIEILDRAYEALVSGDEQQTAVACHYLAVLSDLEQNSRDEPHFLTDFIREAARSRLTSDSCQLQLVAVATQKVANPEAAPQAVAAPGEDAAPDGYPETFGRWHALIASHLPENCDAAKEDLAEFADLLDGSVADGLPVYLAQSTATDYVAVTVDAGDDEARARAVRDAIKQVSARSSDGETGRDSFVAWDRAWSIDPECKAATVVGG